MKAQSEARKDLYIVSSVEAQNLYWRNRMMGISTLPKKKRVAKKGPALQPFQSPESMKPPVLESEGKEQAGNLGAQIIDELERIKREKTTPYLKDLQQQVDPRSCFKLLRHKRQMKRKKMMKP